MILVRKFRSVSVICNVSLGQHTLYICLAEGLVNFSSNDVVIYSENYEHEQPGPGGGGAEAEQVHGGL